MPINIATPGVPISASTTSASGTYPANSTRFVRVVNGSTSLAYIKSGVGAQTATSANIALGPSSTDIFEKGATDDTLAVLLVAGTGIVSFSPVGNPD